MDRDRVQYLTKAGIIAAVYAVLTIFLMPISYGPVQFRISEALTVLPFVEPAAIPGLFVGCIFANYFGGLGWVDIVFGSLTTLLAAYLTSKMPNKYLAVLPPIFLNAFIVAIWVQQFIGEEVKIKGISPYWITVGTIGFGEFVTAGILGLMLLTVFERIKR
ncbi:MAG: QueT transporter family protein [Caloramator sp.]|nr:QueT transporter family protein [Caloramator sp.]